MNTSTKQTRINVVSEALKKDLNNKVFLDEPLVKPMLIEDALPVSQAEIQAEISQNDQVSGEAIFSQESNQSDNVLESDDGSLLCEKTIYPDSDAESTKNSKLIDINNILGYLSEDYVSEEEEENYDYLVCTGRDSDVESVYSIESCPDVEQDPAENDLPGPISTTTTALGALNLQAKDVPNYSEESD